MARRVNLHAPRHYREQAVMSRTRFGPWTIAGISAAVAFGCVHATYEILSERRSVYRLFPKGWGQW